MMAIMMQWSSANCHVSWWTGGDSDNDNILEKAGLAKDLDMMK